MIAKSTSPVPSAMTKVMVISPSGLANTMSSDESLSPLHLGGSKYVSPNIEAIAMLPALTPTYTVSGRKDGKSAASPAEEPAHGSRGPARIEGAGLRRGHARQVGHHAPGVRVTAAGYPGPFRIRDGLRNRAVDHQLKLGRPGRASARPAWRWPCAPRRWRLRLRRSLRRPASSIRSGRHRPRTRREHWSRTEVAAVPGWPRPARGRRRSAGHRSG